VDIGNAFQDFDDMNLETSVGGGVRWYSPLGPIRLDLGVPLDSDAPDSVRIHITLGPDL
jgi:translocation and assembly module TamA